MLTPDQEAAVALLLAQAHADVDAAAGGWFTRAVRRRIGGDRAGRAAGQAATGTRWRDGPSGERPGWRARSAYIAGSDEPVFEIDYETCPTCRIGWVEQPYTLPPYQRRGLAAAGLAALRRDHPEATTWHTLGGHLRDSRRLWDTAGAGVPGGYRKRAPCPHIGTG